MYFGHFHPHSSLIFFPLPLNLFFIPMSPSPTSVPSVFWILWTIGIARMTTGVWQLARGYPSNDHLPIALWWRGDGTILAPSFFAQVFSMG